MLPYDLPLATDLLSRLFADDTACTYSHSDLPTLIRIANLEIQKLANWFRANKMAVNISKTKFIIFHGKGKKVNMENLSVVYNENEISKVPDHQLITPLERVYNGNRNKESRSYKLLGVLFYEQLNFKSHIELICNKINKINKSIYCINRAKNLLSKKALKSLYFALVHPHLLYCINIYTCTAKSNLKRLITLQKKAIRTINHAPSNAHTLPLFTNAKILPLEKLMLQSKLTFMHSIEYGYGLPTFMNCWIKNGIRNQNLNLRNADDYYIPNPRVDSFIFLACHSLWAYLSQLVRNEAFTIRAVNVPFVSNWLESSYFIQCARHWGNGIFQSVV